MKSETFACSITESTRSSKKLSTSTQSSRQSSPGPSGRSSPNYSGSIKSDTFAVSIAESTRRSKQPSSVGETKTEVSLLYEFAQKHHFDVQFTHFEGSSKHAIRLTVESRNESQIK